MKMPDINQIKTAGQAIDCAIDWQSRFDEVQDTGELIKWQDFFTELAEKFPEVKEEFKENGII